MREQNIEKDIPEKIKTTVRNRDHRRCVVCGMPIYEFYPLKAYYAESPSKSNVVLLCPKHVDEARKGILSEENLVEKRKQPFKPLVGTEDNYSIDFQSDVLRLTIGNNQLMRVFMKKEDRFAALKYRNFPILKFDKKDKGLEMTVCMIDKQNNITLLIVNNEVVLSSLNWKIDYSNKVLKIEDSSKKYRFQVRIDAAKDEVVLSEDSFYFDGKKILKLPPSDPNKKGNIVTRTKGDGIVIG